MSLSVDKILRKAHSHIKAGELAEAEELYKQVLSKFPKNKKAIQGYRKLKVGITSKGSSDSKPPQEQFQELLSLYNNGRFEDVLSKVGPLVSLFPKEIFLHNIRGASNASMKRYDAAIESYRKAIKIKPDDADAYANLGDALREKGELHEAIASCEKAIKLRPNLFGAYNNLGMALKDKGELDAAIDSCKKAIKIKPDYADAYYNMGIALKEKGDLDAAIDSCKKALKIKPDYQPARTEKLYQQAHICNWTAIQEDREYISELGISTQHVSPFAILSLEDAPERHRLRSELYAKQNFKQRPMPLPSRPKTKPSRLRIGYFSADFQDHATMYLMAKVFEAHDPEKFELYAYSFGPDKNDEMRQRLIKAVHVFDDVKMMNDKDIALLAQQDKIDIAVDLKGFTKGSRTGIFAYRAAPIQINYLGYPGTMGANFIDYIIADKVVIPEKHEPSYNENIIHLPYSYQVNDNTRVISECSMTRIEMGLPEQGFVFCCFNQNYKISPTEFDIWMRLLRKVEGSVLWLLKSNKWSEDNLRLEAEKRGISSERLIFAEKKPQAEHLARQRLADLFIDTFNVNAHTTTSDALWAGLPVVTKLGKGFAARVAGSLLSAIDMSELITETEQEYESLILDLATNPERLGAIKLELAANRLSKPLFNTELFTKHLEDGYQRAYQQYFDGKKPEAIYVPEQV